MIRLLFLTITFLFTIYADVGADQKKNNTQQNKDVKSPPQHISGAAVEQEVEKAIQDIKNDIEEFKKTHSNSKDSIDNLNSTLEEAQRIKSLNDALTHFAEATKYVLTENLEGLQKRVQNIMATDALKEVVGTLTGTSTSNNSVSSKAPENNDEGDNQETNDEEGDNEEGDGEESNGDAENNNNSDVAKQKN